MSLLSPFAIFVNMISEFAKRISAFVSAHGLLRLDDRVLVTLSGGADSVALLRVLLELGYDCVAAHCNFHLRGEESMRDERFVRALCDSLGVPATFADFDVDSYVADRKVSVEMACRELRYRWFEQMRVEFGCQVIAVAHHADDSAETFFLNLMRGTGLAGLAGIKPRNGAIVRPMLCVGRQDVEAYLTQLQQDYVTDSTNLESEYRRNKIRNIILPALRECFPGSDAALSATMVNLSGDWLLLQELVGDYRRRAVAESDGVVRIDKAVVTQSAHPETLLHELLAPYGYNPTQTSALWKSAATVGAVFESADYLLEVGREQFVLMPHDGLRNDETFVFCIDDRTTLPPFLEVEIVERTPDFKFVADGNLAYFDSEILSHELTLRHWRQGDRFRPFGMKGSKKLSDYFNDNKFSLLDKRRAWLLCASDTILWLVGHRAADAFRVTPATRQIVVLKYRP